MCGDEGGGDDYSKLSRDELIEEIKKLKNKLESPSEEHDEPRMQRESQENGLGKMDGTSRRKEEGAVEKKARKNTKELNFEDYSHRKIALTLSYQGTEHGGLAWQPEVTQRTTVEGELFKALLISRLVQRRKTSDRFESVDFNQPEHLIQSVDIDKWGYSRAGRTDAGVSGSGQVVSLWVRSRLNSAPPQFGFRKKSQLVYQVDEKPEQGTSERPGVEERHESIKDEFGYHTILNSILPSSVRVLAWSPVSEQFDARFSCQARHYKYFFSLYENPHGQALNIQAMREAAQRLVGEHDFRNFCKIDPSKQINNFNRRIISAQINPVQTLDPLQDHDTLPKTHHGSDLVSTSLSAQSNPLFVLDLIGTAFLYNMVRHIVSILFLIGTGLESIDLIDRMFNTEPGLPSAQEGKEAVESKPEYVHANALPLLFYRSIYPEGTFEWIPSPPKGTKPSSYDLFATWSKDRIRAILSYHQLKAHEQFIGDHSPHATGTSSSFYQPLGAAELRPSARYVPVLDRPRAPHFSIINANWWHKIGAQKLAKRQFRRLS